MTRGPGDGPAATYGRMLAVRTSTVLRRTIPVLPCIKA
jgi:hypothetical protein